MPEKHDTPQALEFDALLRLFYSHPIDAFPVLDDALSFAGVLEKRYVEAASRTYSSEKIKLKTLIDRHITHPLPGDIVRKLFGKAKIQPFPVLRTDGSLLGVWELSTFYRVFDSTPLAAHLDFQLLYDRFPLPVAVFDQQSRLLSFNREFSLFSGLHQNDRSVYKRKQERIFKELGWTLSGKNPRKLCTPEGEYLLVASAVRFALETLTVLVISRTHAPASGKMQDAVAALEKRYIVAAMERAHGNISRAAEYLGIPRQTLQYRLTRMTLPAGLFHKHD